MNIRRAETSDLESLVTLFADFRDSLQKSTPTTDQFRASLAQLLATPDVRLFLAFEGDSPIGYAAQRYLVSAWSQGGKEGLVEDLFVKAEFRAHGAGRALMTEAIADARRNGCTAMSLDTNENNAASNALYRSLGFTCNRARWNGGRQIRHDLKLA